jgi:hypothetical protein
LGNWLIETPSVAKLIQDQLDKMERSMATQPHPRCSSLFTETTKNSSNEVTRRLSGNPTPFLSRQLHGRNEVKNFA